MNVKINNRLLELNEPGSLLAVVKKLVLEEKTGIAMAVNGNVVPKKEWPEFPVKENDDIIIIEAAQGG